MLRFGLLCKVLECFGCFDELLIDNPRIAYAASAATLPAVLLTVVPAFTTV